MAVKLLIGLDKSEGAWKAVEYVARTFAQTPGVEVTLLHILGGLPPAYWDDGHILSEKERENRQRLIDNWQAEREKESRQRLVANWQKEEEKKWQELVKKAYDCLTAAGIPSDTVVNKFKPKYFDVAEDILREAETGSFNTIVMGRRGLGMTKTLLLGSVTNKVVQNNKGGAVTIVG